MTNNNGALQECKYTKGHMLLYFFNESSNVLTEQAEEDEKSGVHKSNISSFFDYLKCEIQPFGGTQVKERNPFKTIDCKRFFLKSMSSISSIPVKSDSCFSWDAFGTVSGYALTRVWGEQEEGNVDTVKLYKCWIEQYTGNNNWDLRVDILEGFKKLTIHCSQWDEPFWNALKDFTVPFENYIENKGVKTDGFTKAVRHMVEIWLNIAKRCRGEQELCNASDNPSKEKICENLKTVRKNIIESSSFLFEMISYISNNESLQGASLSSWKDAVVFCILDKMEKRELKANRRIVELIVKKLDELSENVAVSSAVKDEIDRVKEKLISYY